jgi:hypothetical protein
MPIQEEKRAKIQELLKKLSTSGTFESVAITKEIEKVAAETPDRPEIVRTEREPASQEASRSSG